MYLVNWIQMKRHGMATCMSENAKRKRVFITIQGMFVCQIIGRGKVNESRKRNALTEINCSKMCKPLFDVRLYCTE